MQLNILQLLSSVKYLLWIVKHDNFYCKISFIIHITKNSFTNYIFILSYEVDILPGKFLELFVEKMYFNLSKWLWRDLLIETYFFKSGL